MSDTLPGDDRLPRYRRVFDALLDSVVAGCWQPGDRLPSEQSLAEQYGVAPGTVRQAISNLVNDGVLERRQGRGTFVRQPNFTSAMFRFFRFESAGGEALYPSARILSCVRMPPPPAVAEQLGISGRASAIHLSRLRLIGEAPVLAESIWLPYSLFKPLLKVAPDDWGPLLYPLYQEQCGQVIAHAEETLTFGWCDPETADLLNVAPKTPAIIIERLAGGYDGTPLEWRRTLGRAEKFRYRTEIR